jgi:HD superfamily phosphohydrolase
MERLNEEFDGMLDMAIAIFQNKYHKKFLHQLVSSQLDMDRLDYLARDSFYSGVTEGKVGSNRIIKMLSVVDDRLVIEEKGVYSIEKFIVARRLMYWQVYLHRTVLSAEHMLMLVLKRAKSLNDDNLFATPALSAFLNNNYDNASFSSDPTVLENFCDLDDSDILSSMKAWRSHDDKVLSSLSSRLLDRKLFRIELRKEEFSEADLAERKAVIISSLGMAEEEAEYFVTTGSVSNQSYTKDGILIKMKDGSVIDFAQANDNMTLENLSRVVTKYFLCYPKDLTVPERLK